MQLARNNYGWFLATVVGLSAPAGAVEAATDRDSTPTEVYGKEYRRRFDEHRSEIMALIVEKATKTAELRTWPSAPQRSKLLRKFRIAIGKEGGDKMREGDNRTPEGIYFTSEVLDSGLPAEKYGPLAIPLDFPNPVDRLQGKTGYGIWLHGAGNDDRIAEENTTEGCVAFFNSDITRLQDWLRPGRGVVIISRRADEVNRLRDVKRVYEQTTAWVRAWNTRDHKRYLSHYADSFVGRGMGKSAYGAYKRRVFDSYDDMTVAMSNIRVITHPKYAVSIMNQDFNGDDRFVASGRKALYWQRDAEGQWRIVREVYDSGRFKPLTYTPRQLALLTE